MQHLPHPRVIRKIAILTSALGLLVSAGVQSVAAEPYTIFDLGPNATALDVNAAGQVVGNALGASRLTQAFIYDNTGVHLLGTVNGTESFGRAINIFGQTVGGWATADGAVHAFLHSGNAPLLPTDALAAVPGFDRTAANDLNDAGVVVGEAYHFGQDGVEAVKWQQGGVFDLGMLPGASVASATAINAFGRIAGYSNSATTSQHAVLFDAEGVLDLGVLPGGGTSFAFALNNSGQVVGYSEYDNAMHQGVFGHAFLWQNGVMTDLGVGVDSSALGINSSGQIVGTAAFSASSSSHIAFLWQGGATFDLNTLIAPDTGWVLTSANSINDLGQIVGYGTYQGQTHAFILTSVIPEPSTLPLAITALLSLVRVTAARRRSNSPAPTQRQAQELRRLL
jgi:probable HAF family extracellular repeat protein